MPLSGQYLWDWYFDLSDRLRRVRSGVCEPVPPTEYLAWREANEHVVYTTEYAILCAMDLAFRAEMNKELSDYRERQRAEQAAQADKDRRSGRRRRF